MINFFELNENSIGKGVVYEHFTSNNGIIDHGFIVDWNELGVYVRFYLCYATPC